MTQPASGDEHPAGSFTHDYERRMELLVRRLPARIQSLVRRLRRPSARWIRVPVGIVLVPAGFLAILPVFGLWMTPLGLLLLAEDISFLRRGMARLLAWVERRHPGWMGLPEAGENPEGNSSA
ncbi:hypothetical protein NO263_16290 [Gluconacetobacter entanii]|uniref:Tryptophan synthase subunit beta n=1 Tax=Gluconacetobacter entanii TaxID=108528 RepID=A0A318PNS9_9PROT|nr:hypothetical protein [Gluconacetobacter entanii]MBE7618086.1 hypothetical protein [Komagataeibacter sp. FXV2]MCE2577728.1 hypothetical protein [Komagataeibacter sp. FNDCR1]MCW4592144.1 hypothetical protein [Gluconacetobacter entanii]MCW4595847.1 hypothetical protein [Gluconacetobacter entanii]NPC87359.1 hypothetical protein [Gluconacetobacter entanii]